jgi:hypothetical protein
MTDVAGSIKKIQVEEVQYLDPQGSYYQKIAATLNGLIDSSASQVVLGEIRISEKSEALFQSERGSGWVVMKGQDITGSSYAPILNSLTGSNILPDMRGKFIRVRDDGTGTDPDQPRNVGIEQNSEIKEHDHYFFNESGLGDGPLKNNDDYVFGQRVFTIPAETLYTLLRSFGGDPLLDPDIGQTSIEGENSRPVNVAVNFFIRIN